jgi:hypothetical protein
MYESGEYFDGITFEKLWIKSFDIGNFLDRTDTETGTDNNVDDNTSPHKIRRQANDNHRIVYYNFSLDTT